jgi:hypothetical protein
MKQVWSCGGGVQSVAIAALIYTGKIEAPDFSVMADTGYERSSTWEYIEFLQKKVPVEIVKASDYATVGLWGGKEKKTLLIPAFTDINGEPAKMGGFCSNEWKRRVIDRWLREQGVTSFRRWIGFSTDELRRAKNYDDYYPLIWARMSRNDCLSLIESLGWPMPPRSSCWMCPNHSPQEWREIRASDDWQKVVAFDEAMREKDPNAWLTRDIQPIDSVDFDSPARDLFEETDCESGVCFV